MKPFYPITLALAGVTMVVAKPLTITFPAETVRLIESRMPGYALATASCATCHSVDYISMQPTSSRTYWKAAVTKMQKTFGAPIPDSAVEPLVDYLTKTYGNERPGAMLPAAAKPSASSPSGK